MLDAHDKVAGDRLNTANNDVEPSNLLSINEWKDTYEDMGGDKRMR